jgi:drug/metabolite transporter (DMT)-like permease
VSPTSPESGTDPGHLEWLLVASTRHSWTALSVTILAAAGWALLGRYRGYFFTPMGFAFAALALLSGAAWIHAQRRVLALHRSLSRPLPWSRLCSPRATRLRSPTLQGG